MGVRTRRLRGSTKEEPRREGTERGCTEREHGERGHGERRHEGGHDGEAEIDGRDRGTERELRERGQRERGGRERGQRLHALCEPLPHTFSRSSKSCCCAKRNSTAAMNVSPDVPMS